jgi:chemosensory pili system protein ChpA (sensor histidine kinase/response regulator)
MAAELIQIDQALELMQKGQLGVQEESEATSSTASRNFEMDNMLSAVVTAALDDIQKIKDAILDFIKDSTKAENITLCQTLLMETRGAMNLLNQDRAVKVVDGLVTYLREQDIVEFMDTNRLDQLSQVVVAIEYFLEALGEQRDDTDSILAFASTQLDLLLEGKTSASPAAEGDFSDTQNLVIDDSGSVQVIDESELQDVDLDNMEAELGDADESVQDQAAPVESLDVDLASESSAEPDEIEIAEQAPEPTEEPVSPELVDDISESLEDIQVALEGEEPELELAPESLDLSDAQSIEDIEFEPLLDAEEVELVGDQEPLVAETGEAAPIAQPEVELLDEVPAEDSEQVAIQPVDDDQPVLKPGTDEEILEIYLEEAEEETENIQQQQRDWKLHPEDENALKNIRRSFHTIKGSGRLVGAMKIGEFAWDFENLLNRVIDNTVSPSDQVIDAVGLAIEGGHPGPQPLKKLRCCLVGCTVGAVQHYFLILQRFTCRAFQKKLHITIPGRSAIDDMTDMSGLSRARICFRWLH